MTNIEFTTSEITRAENITTRICRYHKTEPDVALTCRQNLKWFLDRFPKLIETGASLFAGAKWDWSDVLRHDPIHSIPLADHTYRWRVRGLRGVLVVTTFPYNSYRDVDVDIMLEFAEKHGLSFEIAPPDVPDFYNPGWTTPTVWTCKGRDWRAVAGEKS